MADLPLTTDAGAQPVNIVDPESSNDAVINSDGSFNTNGSGKSTYSSSVLGLHVAATPTDIFTITGSATKVVRVLRFEVSGTATTGSVIDTILLKRSTANSAGTSTIQTNVPHDSLDAAATATVRAYTANPTVGTLVGNIRVFKEIITNTGSNQTAALLNITPEETGKPWILRGASEVLAINLNSVTLTGNNFNIDIAWTEE